MKRKLNGSDILLNLKEINIIDLDSFSSASCTGRTEFVIETDTKEGSCEDPNFTGKIEVLISKKDKINNTYLLKVKFTRENAD